MKFPFLLVYIKPSAAYPTYLVRNQLSPKSGSQPGDYLPAYSNIRSQLLRRSGVASASSHGESVLLRYVDMNCDVIKHALRTDRLVCCANLKWYRFIQLRYLWKEYRLRESGDDYTLHTHTKVHIVTRIS